MRACIHETYGGPEVLRLEEVATPAPGDNELLIRTHATTVTSADWRALSLDLPLGFGLVSRLLFGVTRPRQPTLGTEIAGRVESVGKDVSRFDVGDEVFASTGDMGCHAEYKCMPEDGAVVHRPANLTWGEAAALSFGGTTALVFFKKAELRKGERVLVNGASGAVGTAAVQIARHFGADVTGVCSGRNVELVKSLGANRVIDYTREDFTENGETYDVIVDTVGTAPYSRSKESLSEDGRLLLVLADLPDMLPMLPIRQTAVAVGVLFLTATITFLTADSIITGVLGNPDALVDVSAYGNVLKAAALLAFVGGLAVVGIAILMYPLLKEDSEPLALGYVGFRVAELAAVVHYLAVPLLLVALGEGVLGDTLDASASQHLGSLLQAKYEVALLMVFLFTSVAGIIFAFLLYRSSLVPRPLAVLGLFELILPIWLIAKGFARAPATAARALSGNGR